jgi:two-component system sensor histidine kinase ChvG
MLTTLTSISADKGCWAVVTSRSGLTFLEIAADKPFWRTPLVQIAAAIYILSAALIVWLVLDIRRNVALFRQAARRIRLRGETETSFKEANRIPELSAVAEDFDMLVKALLESQAMVKRTAEENAHALKTLLAVIAQSLERLRASISESDPHARRNLALIERATERLDGLVSAMRELDRASADSIYPERWRMNLSVFLERLLASYQGTLVPENKSLHVVIEPGIHVFASEDLLEPVIENILENAASFTPAGSSIRVSLKRAAGFAELSFADEGIGVEPAYMDKIFERYYSRRPHSTANADSDEHFGLGLWIVKRNIEAMGGSVSARANAPRGLVITARLPIAH